MKKTKRKPLMVSWTSKIKKDCIVLRVVPQIDPVSVRAAWRLRSLTTMRGHLVEAVSLVYRL